MKYLSVYKYVWIAVVSACIISWVPCYVHAQRQGDTWVMGYSSGTGNPDYSVMHLNFSSGQCVVEYPFDQVLSYWETSSSISNAEGNVILSTNGQQIFGQYGVIIEDTIAYDGIYGYWDYFNGPDQPYGFPQMDGAIILPVPETENEYEVIYHYGVSDFGSFKISQLRSARIRFRAFNDFEVLYKDQPVGNSVAWWRGHINAVRHANGRDWWVIAFQNDSKTYFAFLLDPQGIQLHHSAEVDVVIEGGLGDASFSKSGNYYARMDAVEFTVGQFISVFSFDRCAGDLTRIATIQTPTASFYTGVAFSPSERYLYGDDRTHLWQWDLEAADIPGSQLLIDTFDGFVQPGWFELAFAHLTEAPDGRIYMVPPNGSSDFFHVIDRPNLGGKDCWLRQHHLNLHRPKARTAPNVANFRLGPLDGAPCDTLGINNLPVAWWRYEEDQVGFWQNIRFTDLSYFDPTTWHWDFGDGTTSSEQHPVHDFEPGLYQVCLTVSNAFASDSMCEWIEILLTSTNDLKSGSISIFPNPFEDFIEIKNTDDNLSIVNFELVDMHGRTLLSKPSISIPSRLFLPDLPSGIYFIIIQEQGKEIKTFKMIKT
jgi:hypothetical protein